MLEGLSLQANGIYSSSIQAINNIWGRIRDIELLTVALVKHQEMLSKESYQNAVQRALIKYQKSNPHRTKPDWETYLMKEVLERAQEERPELFTHPNNLLEKKEVSN